MKTMNQIFFQMDMAVEEALSRSTLTFAERRAARRNFRRSRRAALGMAAAEFAAANGYEFDDGDGDSDTPILDFWKWLIESGKLSEFLQKLVNEYLPKIFQMILEFISAIAGM